MADDMGLIHGIYRRVVDDGETVTEWYEERPIFDRSAPCEASTPEQLQAMCDAKQAETDARHVAAMEAENDPVFRDFKQWIENMTTAEMANLRAKVHGDAGSAGIKPFPQRALDAER